MTFIADCDFPLDETDKTYSHLMVGYTFIPTKNWSLKSGHVNSYVGIFDNCVVYENRTGTGMLGQRSETAKTITYNDGHTRQIKWTKVLCAGCRLNQYNYNPATEDYSIADWHQDVFQDMRICEMSGKYYVDADPFKVFNGIKHSTRIFARAKYLRLSDLTSSEWGNEVEADLPSLESLFIKNVHFTNIYHGSSENHDFMSHLKFYYGPESMWNKLNEKGIAPADCIKYFV
jgi:hypothetical protein